MKRTALVFVAIGTTIVLLGAVSSAGSAINDRDRARMATRYLVESQSDDGSLPGFSPIGSTADAVVSFAAARRAPGALQDALDYLAINQGEVGDVGEIAKVVLALVAAGRDPNKWEGRDLVDEIKQGEVKGRYGDLEWSYVFDQALSILALEAAGERVPADAIEWLREAQCGNGGWQFDRPASPDENRRCFDAEVAFDNVADTNTTSYVIQALTAARPNAPLPGRPYQFFEQARDRFKDGWVFAPEFACRKGEKPPSCSASDTNSTALVIQAFAARDKAFPDGSRKALRSLQRRLCGKNAGAFAASWTYDDGRFVKSPPDLGATIGAIPALLKKAFPIGPVTDLRPAPRAPEC